ncbi:hypothetical protein E2C01_043824 [Portunus trituberculatus]|uniref:Uncharacterized protein n=1 Tax=Portunus trituberculatus TaxID=210409 RepID=A0A5B7FXE5_PORTR|nr:hypothetical protein [Portunus trituberculatus]
MARPLPGGASRRGAVWQPAEGGGCGAARRRVTGKRAGGWVRRLVGRRPVERRGDERLAGRWQRRRRTGVAEQPEVFLTEKYHTPELPV